MLRDLAAARFYAILDTAYVPRARWRDTGAALLAGGADLVQVRAKREDAATREALAREILPLFESPHSDAEYTTGTPRPHFIINDDVALSARLPGAGLHLGQDDLPPEEARRQLGPDRVIGLSTHSWPQAQAALNLAAGTISYFCVGPVFATPTKPDYDPVGLELVRQVAAAKPMLPWFVIGGITRANLDRVIAAGAPRIVVVSDVLRDPDPAGAVRQLRTRCP